MELVRIAGNLRFLFLGPSHGVLRVCRVSRRLWTMDGYRGHLILEYLVDKKGRWTDS